VVKRAVFPGDTSVGYDLLKAVRPVRESLYDDRNERTIRRCDLVTLAPNDETRYDAVDDEVRLEIALRSRCKCSCEKSLATVNLLTIGEGRGSWMTLQSLSARRESDLSVRVGVLE